MSLYVCINWYFIHYLYRTRDLTIGGTFTDTLCTHYDYNSYNGHGF